MTRQNNAGGQDVKEGYDSVVSIEIHVQLNTASKLFCRCEAAYGEEPNSRVCPVCLGLPGSLPVLNEKAVEMAVRTALALDCTIHERSAFDRKNYFYPDLPKSYQIMQHYLPIATGGRLEIETRDGQMVVKIERVHIEEDAGKTVYLDETGETLIDFNRCGVGLLEIVTRPWVTKPAEVHAYLNAVKRLFQYIEVSDCDMEKGNLRCDTNISVMPHGSTKWGTRTEVKNLNSFRAVRRALEYERNRQIRVIESGARVVLETMLWDDARGETLPQRSKEEAHDYRYFPEPDLPPLTVSPELIDRTRSEMPELPAARRQRFMEQYHLPTSDADVLTAEKALADFFEETLKHHDKPKTVSNWVMGEVLREMNERSQTADSLGLKPQHLAELVKLVESGTITGTTAKKVLSAVLDTGKTPSLIVEEEALAQSFDEGQLRTWVQQAIAENPRAVQDYKNGKKTAAQFIVGQAMKKSRGQANPRIVLGLVEQLLSSL